MRIIETVKLGSEKKEIHEISMFGKTTYRDEPSGASNRWKRKLKKNKMEKERLPFVAEAIDILAR